LIYSKIELLSICFNLTTMALGINAEFIDGCLWNIYKMISADHIPGAMVLTRRTLRILSATPSYSPAMSSACIDLLYRVLLDLTFKRPGDAHNRIRNFHYRMLVV